MDKVNRKKKIEAEKLSDVLRKIRRDIVVHFM